MNHHRVWITGVGTANPLGLDYRTTVRNLLEGKSGIGRVDYPGAGQLPCQLAGLLPPLPTPPDWTADDLARLDALERLLLHCCLGAWGDGDTRATRAALVVGVGAEWLVNWEARWHVGGAAALAAPRDPAPLVRRVRQHLGLSGPTVTVAAACASGNFALGQGRRLIEQGLADVCLAGGVDNSVSFTSIACFGNLGVLSRRNDDPATASRPFDRDRDGLVLADGGAMFLLERADRARARGARPYAEFAGFGASSDAYHMIIPSPDPGPAVQAMRAALADAAINPDETDYVNAHATSTPVGDRNETAAIRQVLGEQAACVPVSATKSMTGHLLSGAAALDAVACLAALEQQAVPPTINLDNPDPECDLCHVPREARPHRVRVALSNSFGFGGNNSCIILRRAG
jgi:3-oxoacyl-[acyl-carrier-protein] synthase II